MVSDQVRKSSKAIFPFPKNDGTSSAMSTKTEQQIIEDTKPGTEPGAQIAEFRFILQIAIMMQLSLFSPLKVSAQNLGLTTIGSTSYPTAIVGNNVSLNTYLHGDSNYLVADQYTTTVPLAAVQTMTNGSGGGNLKVSIYSNATGNVPGSKLCTGIKILYVFNEFIY